MDLWKYCTAEHCREMLLSFQLLGETDWPDEKVMACLYALANHAERHYEPIQIPKKNGKTRTLLAPDRLLCRVQKNILRHILEERPISPSAAAYHKEASPVLSAAVHVGQPLILKLDIEDFFGNITFPMVLRHAFPGQYFPPAVGTLLTSLCCYRDYLPQGAPTSPAISNLVMRPFDEYMEQWCKKRGIAYSRYCDDMTFSGDFDADAVRRKVYGYLRAMGLEPNREKTTVTRRGGRQLVTGIVVNEKLQVPADYRRALRQEIYYSKKYGAEEHLNRTGRRHDFPEGYEGAVRYLESLLGKINYVLSVNRKDAWFAEAKKTIEREIKDGREADHDPAGL